MTIRAKLAPLALATALVGGFTGLAVTSAPAADAGSLAGIAWTPWKSGSSVGSGGRASNITGSYIKITCTLQRLHRPWYSPTTLTDNVDTRSATGYGAVQVFVSEPYKSGSRWRTFCKVTSGSSTMTVWSGTVSL